MHCWRKLSQPWQCPGGRSAAPCMIVVLNCSLLCSAKVPAAVCAQVWRLPLFLFLPFMADAADGSAADVGADSPAGTCAEAEAPWLSAAEAKAKAKARIVAKYSRAVGQLEDNDSLRAGATKLLLAAVSAAVLAGLLWLTCGLQLGAHSLGGWALAALLLVWQLLVWPPLLLVWRLVVWVWRLVVWEPPAWYPVQVRGRIIRSARP